MILRVLANSVSTTSQIKFSKKNALELAAFEILLFLIEIHGSYGTQTFRIFRPLLPFEAFCHGSTN